MSGKKDASPFKFGKKGVAARARTGGKFVSIAPDESVVMVPLVGLDGMVSAEMHQYWDSNPPVYHPCIGKDCPGELVGNEPRFKGYLPVVLKGETEPSVYAFTISVYNQLESLEDALDGETIQGMAIKISRNGSGLKTRYVVIGTGKRVDVDVEVPDFVSWLGPTTPETIWDLLESTGDYDREDYVAPKPKRGRPAKKAAPPASSEDDDETDDDDETGDPWAEV